MEEVKLEVRKSAVLDRWLDQLKDKDARGRISPTATGAMFARWEIGCSSFVSTAVRATGSMALNSDVWSFCCCAAGIRRRSGETL